MKETDDVLESNAISWKNPFETDFTNPISVFQSHNKLARRFHIRNDLWVALAGGLESEERFRFEEMRDAIWPFDDVTIIPSAAPVLRFEDDHANSYRQASMSFSRRSLDDRAFIIQFIDEISLLSRGRSSYEVAQQVYTSTGMYPHQWIRPNIPGVEGFYTPENLEIRSRDLAHNLRAFVNFCDMLKYCGSIIEVRNMVKGLSKRKVTTMEAIRKQNYRDVEIVLRPHFTIHQIEQIVSSGIAGFERAHPRRHQVREHLRVLANGKIIVVSGHLRGGISGPGPAYNCGPISRWYTDQSRH